MKKGILTLFVVIIVLLCIVSLFVLNEPLRNNENLRYTTDSGDAISATYYPGTRSWGVMILEGFGSDQIAMKTMTTEFVRLGYHGFTFDYTGHGRSEGSIGFDNAETDNLALQVIDALDQFTKMSSLEISNIIVVGHSLGARVALQVQTMINSQFAGIVLVGAQISLVTNTQSEFFTGVTDLDIPWIQSLNPETIPNPILMITSTWDDILPPEAARLLFQKLTNVTIGSEDQYQLVVDSVIKELTIYQRILHSFETYAPKIISQMVTWVNDITQVENEENISQNVLFKVIAWIVGSISFLVLPIVLSRYDDNNIIQGESMLDTLMLENYNKFIIWKFLLWILGLPIAILLFVPLFFLPFDLPVFSLTILGFISGYGVINYLLYRLGRFPGVGTSQDAVSNHSGTSDQNAVLISMGFSLIYFVGVAILSNTGINVTYPINQRLVWLFVFTVINAFAYYTGNSELIWFYKLNRPGRDYRLLLLNALLPFILLTIFYIALSSLSGIQGNIVNLVKYGLTLSLGWYVQKKGNNVLVTSFLQSFLLQFLILPQGALFEF